MRLLVFVIVAIVAHGVAALRVTPGPTSIGRRDALAAVPALFAVAPAFASTVGAAPTPEDEAKFNEILKEKLKEKEKQFAAMGETLDKEDIEATEYLLRTSLCGFQAKLKCKGSGKPPK